MITKEPDGSFAKKLVHIQRPLLRIPTLCIHLQTADERAKFAPNTETHLQPILGMLGESLNSPSDDEVVDERHAPQLLRLLSAELGCAPSAIMDFEMTLCDLNPAQIWGAPLPWARSSIGCGSVRRRGLTWDGQWGGVWACIGPVPESARIPPLEWGSDSQTHPRVRGTAGINNEFVSAPRLDNQIHCFTALEALLHLAANPNPAAKQAGIACSHVFGVAHQPCLPSDCRCEIARDRPLTPTPTIRPSVLPNRKVCMYVCVCVCTVCTLIHVH